MPRSIGSKVLEQVFEAFSIHLSGIPGSIVACAIQNEAPAARLAFEQHQHTVVTAFRLLF